VVVSESAGISTPSKNYQQAATMSLNFHEIWKHYTCNLSASFDFKSLVRNVLPMLSLPVLAAMALGLNLPKTFSGLAILFLWAILRYRFDLREILESRTTVYASVLLVLFGISYSFRQLQLEVWPFSFRALPDVVCYSLMPAWALITGRLLGHRFGQRMVSAVIIGFAFGGLLYVLFSVLISHVPWYDIFQKFPSSVAIPWSDHGVSSENVRSVEQRAYLALLLLPVAISGNQKFVLTDFIKQKNVNFYLLLSALAAYSLWSLNGRLGFVALVFGFVPCAFIQLAKLTNRKKLYIIAVLCSLIVILMHKGLLCDERFFMQAEFIRHIPSYPWGGRQIEFAFTSCPGLPASSFAEVAHLAHNIFLDVINDVGIIPCSFLLLSSTILLHKIVPIWITAVSDSTWNFDLSLRYAVFVVIVLQALFQPFLYSDQAMYTISYCYTGILLSERIKTRDHLG